MGRADRRPRGRSVDSSKHVIGQTTIGDAQATLTANGYAATIPTSACGLAYFNGLASTTYSVSVAAPGYATTTIPAITIVGNTATTTMILP